MQSNVHSPFYFSGQLPRVTDQWALIDQNDRIVLVDQDLRTIKYTHLCVSSVHSFVSLSDASNYSVLDNVKVLMLKFVNNKISASKYGADVQLAQEKLLYIRFIINFILTESEFHIQQNQQKTKNAKMMLMMEKEFFQAMFPENIGTTKIYDDEIAQLELYIFEAQQLKSAVLHLLATIDLSESLPVINKKFIQKFNSLSVTSRYFDDYIKPKLNAQLAII